MNSTYRVEVTRDNGGWLARAVGLDGVHTFARTLAKLDGNIREAIALAGDLHDGAEAELDIAYDYRLGDPDLEAEATRLRQAREQVDIQRRDVTAATERIAVDLVRRHRLTVRDAAALTGVSSARVGQLVPGGQARSA